MASLGCLHMSTLEPSDSHTPKTLLLQYIVVLSRKLLSAKFYHHFLLKLKQCRETQDELLLWWLQENSQTEYGKRYDFSNIKSREDYVARHPLTTFAHYEHYMNRISNGEKNILTKRDVVYLCLSSGTTGKNKLYPKTTYDKKTMITFYLSFMHITRDILNKVGLRREFHFTIHHPAKFSPAGIPMGGLGMYWSKMAGNLCIVPSYLDEIIKEAPSYYVQAIFALSEKQIALFSGYSSDLMFALFKFVENHAADLCEDIEHGHIRPFPDLPEQTRMKMNTCLKPKPIRAQELRDIFAKGSKRMALSIWPKLVAVQVCKTGGFAHCAQMLSDSYLKDTKMAFGLHGSTEGFCGLSLETDTDKDYILTFSPINCFLEFIAVEDMANDQPKTFFLDQVE